MKEKNKQQINSPRRSNQYILSFLIFSLVASVTLNVYLSLSKQDDVLASVGQGDELSLLNPARKFTKQEDLIVNFQPLRDYLNSTYEKDPDISIYFEYLPTGANISINKDAEFYPASLLKVPVAMAVAKKIEKGEWKWTNELVLMSTDKDDRFGTLYKSPSNSTFTIEELVRRSLSDSDNTAHFMLVRNLEMEEMKDVYNHMGLEGFLETEGILSAKRYAVIVRALYAASYNSEEHSQRLLSYMTHSPFHEYLQNGLPQDVLFAHKIGVDEEKKIYLDSGIVYLSGRPYILTVMTKNKNDAKAREIMKNISEKVYNYVSNYTE